MRLMQLDFLTEKKYPVRDIKRVGAYNRSIL
jgi:hypothetical protein